MPEDMALSDSVSGVSRSGRVRKKSAKLMEMEDYHTPSFEVDYTGETPKGGRKRPPVPTKLISPPSSIGSPHHSPPYNAVPDTTKTPGTTSTASKRKTTFASPPATTIQAPSAQRKAAGSTTAVVVTTPPVPKSHERVIAIKQPEPTSQSFEALSGNSSCYLMGDDIHFITGEPVGALESDRQLSPLKIDIGSGGEHHSVAMRDDSDGLRMKFILSPKVGGSGGGSHSKPETTGKRKGVTARRNPADLMSRPPSKKSVKVPTRASPKSPARKRPSGGRKQPSSTPSALTALDVLAAGGIPPMDQDLSSADFSDEDELGNSLVIAEPLPKKFDQSDRSRSSRPSAKSKLKLGSSKASSDHVGGETVLSTSDGSMQQQSLYLKEKLSAKKKSGKKVVKHKDEGKSEKKPRPVSAYMLFCKDHRQRLLRENKNLDFATLSRKLGEIWKSMADSDKLQWRRKAKNAPYKHAALIKSSGGKMLDSRKQKSPGSGGGGRQQQQNWSNARLQEELQNAAKEPVRVVSTTPLDVAAYLKLLGESLSIIGQRLTEHEGQIAVSGSLSVLLDSTLCALGPLLCLSSEVQEMDGCPKPTQESILDNIAYIMPGL